jgi:hypothetical protein
MDRLAQLYCDQYLWDQAWEVAEAWAQAAQTAGRSISSHSGLKLNCAAFSNRKRSTGS